MTLKKRSAPHTPASPRTVLPGSEKAPFVQTTGEKPAPSGAKLTVSVVVKRKAPLKAANRTGKERLTHAQYRKNHGADPDAVKLVRAFAKEYGLTVAPDTPGPERRAVKLVGTVAAMQKAFGVTLVHKAHEGVTYRVREGSITLPSKLVGPVEASSASTTARRHTPTFASSAKPETSAQSSHKAAASPNLTPAAAIPLTLHPRSRRSINSPPTRPAPAKPSESSS